MPLARHVAAEKPEDKIIEADWARIHNITVLSSVTTSSLNRK